MLAPRFRDCPVAKQQERRLMIHVTTSKQMPAHKLGKLWEFKATEVDEWIRAGKAREEPQH